MMKDMDFPHFEVLSGDSTHSDHHYSSSNKSKKKVQDRFSNPNSDLSRTIAKEWRSLQKNLPDSIYLRTYEDRMDLLRAVIIGSPGTPYHDGLFFFDIVLPSDYPKSPPKVYYHAHGMRLNPNLYASGYVCLSLLRTWYGSGVELWTKNSTILQLLVSLQGLVLNEKPYFNEPGYGKGLKNMNDCWRKKSMAYNEDVFIYSCKTMLCKMRQPPKGFEKFVVAYFRERGDFILRAIKAYSNGEAALCEYKEGENGNGMGASSSSTPSVNVSKKFKANLEAVHGDLRRAFVKLDRCVRFEDEVKEDEMALRGIAEKPKSKDILGKIWKGLLNVFGMKKKKVAD